MKAILAALATALSLFASDVEKGNFGAEISGPSKPKTTTWAKRNSYPFSGEIESHNDKSLTLKGKKKSRVFLLTADTRMLRDGVTARPQEGEYVSGSARKNIDGKEEAITVTLKGAKPAK